MTASQSGHPGEANRYREFFDAFVRAKLRHAFVRETYSKACSLVRESGTVVAVGYSFNKYDNSSYGPILQALDASRERKLIVVSPHAADLAEKVSAEYPRLRVQSIKKTLEVWGA